MVASVIVVVNYYFSLSTEGSSPLLHVCTRQASAGRNEVELSAVNRGVQYLHCSVWRPFAPLPWAAEQTDTQESSASSSDCIKSPDAEAKSTGSWLDHPSRLENRKCQTWDVLKQH